MLTATICVTATIYVTARICEIARFLKNVRPAIIVRSARNCQTLVISMDLAILPAACHACRRAAVGHATAIAVRRPDVSATRVLRVCYSLQAPFLEPATFRSSA